MTNNQKVSLCIEFCERFVRYRERLEEIGSPPLDVSGWICGGMAWDRDERSDLLGSLLSEIGDAESWRKFTDVMCPAICLDVPPSLKVVPSPSHRSQDVRSQDVQYVTDIRSAPKAPSPLAVAAALAYGRYI
jgi:hypothetical protein